MGWQEGFGDLGTEDRRRREESGMEDWDMG